MPRRSQALDVAFGVRLRKLRSVARLSQDTLARRAGLQRTSITNIENARQHVSLDVLYRLSDAMGLTPADLLPPREEVQEFDELGLGELTGLAEWDQQYVRAVVKKSDATGG